MFEPVRALLALVASAATADPMPRALEGVLSEDDRAWARAHRVVRVGVTEVPWPPYDLVPEDGEHRGITADYLELLATRSGFRLERIRFKTFPRLSRRCAAARWICWGRWRARLIARRWPGSPRLTRRARR